MIKSVLQETLTIEEIFNFCNESADEARKIYTNIIKDNKNKDNFSSIDVNNAIFFLQREQMFRCEIPDMVCKIINKKEK